MEAQQAFTGRAPILIGMGGNRRGGSAEEVRVGMERALSLFPAYGITPLAVSSWYRTKAVSAVPQEEYINGVAAVASMLPPLALLAALQRVEKYFARRRFASKRHFARSLDLDLLAWGHRRIGGGENGGRLILPHPRMHERGFVLAPLAELCPGWRHPVLGVEAGRLLAGLSAGERDSVRRIGREKKMKIS